MKPLAQTFATAALIAVGHHIGNAQVRVIEESAIPFTAILSKADFDARFAGTIQQSTAELQSGWYVAYTHQDLNYYFGPILLESTGQDYLNQLEGIVEEAVAQRPSITDYDVFLTFEPSQSSSNSRSNSSTPPPTSSSGGSGNPTSTSGSSSIWSLLLKVFGF